MKLERQLLSALVLAIYGAASPSASAQEESADADAEPMIIMEVLVTARRREDSLQEVPLSVSAFSSEQIESRGLRDLHDLSQETSGLIY